MRYGGILFAALASVSIGLACSSFESDEGGAGNPDAGMAPETGGPDEDANVPGEDAAVDAAGDGGGLPCADPSRAPAPLANVAGGASLLTNDGSYVYWRANGNEIQRKAVASGSSVETPVRWGGVPINDFVVTSNGYLFMHTTGMYYALIGASTTDAGTYVGSPFPPLAVFGTATFALNTSLIFRSVAPNGVGIVGDPTGTVSAMAANAQHLYFIATQSDGGAGTAIYRVGNVQTSQVPSKFYDESGRTFTALAVDGTDVYLLDDNLRVLGVPISGGKARLLAAQQPGLLAIAVRNGVVYYSTSGGIRSVPGQGGCVSTVTSGPTPSFTVTDTEVFFVSGADVMRVAR